MRRREYRKIVVRGEFDDCEIDLPFEYFRQRSITLDCRGLIRIHKSVRLSRYIYICTGSHKIDELGVVVTRPVTIEKDAWIGSNVTLYNCTIGEGAIVAVGSVVRSRNVPPYTMVEGNPARMIAMYGYHGWSYLDEPKDLKRRTSGK